MMFARNLKPGQTVKVSPEDGGEILHISQVCMSKPVDGNRTYLKIIQGSQSFAACVLQRDKQESCSVDLFLSAREGLQLGLEGGKNELSVIGYFEPEPESESDGDGDDDMAAFGEDSEDESEDVSDDDDVAAKMKAPVDGRIEDLDAQEEDAKKKAKGTNKKAQALKALQAAASNDDGDDDDDEDDDEDGEDDEDGDDDGGSGEDEDGSDDDDGEEEESDAEPAPAPQSNNKRKGQQQQQQQHQQQQQQLNKKAKTQAGSTNAASGDEATYKNALIEFLKKNGPTPLASLGQKVKKPANLPKMATILKAHPNVFAVEGGKCSLK